MTVAVDMGTAPDGAPAVMDLEELLATRLLVQGNSGSGKSHLLRRLLEGSAPWVQQVIIDPEGDFVTLSDRYGHVVVDGGAHSELELKRLALRIREQRVSVVLTLESLDVEGQMRAAATFIGTLFDAPREHWFPALVVVDEAQLFAPAVAGEVSDEVRRLSLGAMTNLMCRGRKRGMAGVIATQRLAKLAKNVAAEASNFLMGRTFLDIDMARASDLLGMERRQAEMFRDLERGHFIALGPALSRRPLPLKIGPVETATRGMSPKLMPLPQTASEDMRELILKAPEPEPMRPIVRRTAPAAPPPDILTQLAQSRPAPLAERGRPAPRAATPEELAETARKIDEVLRQVAADPDAGFRPVAVLYQDFLVRCRIHNLAGKPLDIPAFRRRLATIRAGVGAEAADSPEWAQALAIAASLPDDVQGVFLLLARAALDRLPCPSDGTIARAYGSRSLGRARRLLTYMEEQGSIVCRQDLAGHRIVTLPELGWETTPGDPNAPDPSERTAELA